MGVSITSRGEKCTTQFTSSSPTLQPPPSPSQPSALPPSSPAHPILVDGCLHDVPRREVYHAVYLLHATPADPYPSEAAGSGTAPEPVQPLRGRQRAEVRPARHLHHHHCAQVPPVRVKNVVCANLA
jgi:hypothetical protein